MHPIIDITAHYKSKRSLDTHDLSVPKKERAAFFRLEYRGRPKCRWGFLAVPTLHGPRPAGSFPWVPLLSLGTAATWAGASSSSAGAAT